MVKLSGYCYVLELAYILESFSIVYGGRAGKRGAVSYTHLTLPTKLEV